VISGFCHGANETLNHFGRPPVSIGRQLPTFWGKPSVPKHQ